MTHISTPPLITETTFNDLFLTTLLLIDFNLSITFIFTCSPLLRRNNFPRIPPISPEYSSLQFPLTISCPFCFVKVLGVRGTINMGLFKKIWWVNNYIHFLHIPFQTLSLASYSFWIYYSFYYLYSLGLKIKLSLLS